MCNHYNVLIWNYLGAYPFQKNDSISRTSTQTNSYQILFNVISRFSRKISIRLRLEMIFDVNVFP